MFHGFVLWCFIQKFMQEVNLTIENLSCLFMVCLFQKPDPPTPIYVFKLWLIFLAACMISRVNRGYQELWSILAMRGLIKCPVFVHECLDILECCLGVFTNFI